MKWDPGVNKIIFFSNILKFERKQRETVKES